MPWVITFFSANSPSSGLGCSYSNMPAVLEHRNGKRADDIAWDATCVVHTCPEHGTALVWNATCVDSLALSHLLDSSKKADSAAELAERSKS